MFPARTYHRSQILLHKDRCAAGRFTQDGHGYDPAVLYRTVSNAEEAASQLPQVRAAAGGTADWAVPGSLVGSAGGCGPDAVLEVQMPHYMWAGGAEQQLLFVRSAGLGAGVPQQRDAHVDGGTYHSTQQRAHAGCADAGFLPAWSFLGVLVSNTTSTHHHQSSLLCQRAA
jgi:hypothetical protein